MKPPNTTHRTVAGAGVLVAAVAACALVGIRPAHAEEKPLWELGLGVGGFMFKDYRGADTTHVYPVPVPYILYRGKFLESTREGVKGKLLNNEHVQLNISVNATPPVRNNSARAGMPDVKSTLELGPSLEVHVWRSANQRMRFDVRLPARAAVTLEAKPHYVGWLFAPHLSLDVADVAGFAGWRMGLLTGPLFATSRYDDYFYSVAPQFATAGRPAYQAHGGYSGTEFLASLSKRYDSYWVGAFARYDSLSGASFEHSPLVKSRSYWTAGIGIAWMISQSSRLVEAED